MFPVIVSLANDDGYLKPGMNGEVSMLVEQRNKVVAVPNDAVRTLREGVELDDGPTAPARVRVVQRETGRAALEITIHEGRNRQVRRMCDAIGHPVRRLVRTRIGPIRDAHLKPTRV